MKKTMVRQKREKQRLRERGQRESEEGWRKFGRGEGDDLKNGPGSLDCRIYSEGGTSALHYPVRPEGLFIYSNNYSYVQNTNRVVKQITDSVL